MPIIVVVDGPDRGVEYDLATADDVTVAAWARCGLPEAIREYLARRSRRPGGSS